MINFSEIFEHPVYEVGGCVRDSLLGEAVKDIDIASSLPPEEFKEICRRKKLKTFDTGIEHGTVTVLIKGIPYEHTTFRKDVSCDGRNATVEYSQTIETDLSRRDFTINAIARMGDSLIDPFGGINDLNLRLLKTVGSAKERFSEDYLRIIRAARFKSRLSMNADTELISAAKELSPYIIEYVSIERITDEVRKAQKHGAAFFKTAEELGFLHIILPETATTSFNKEVWIEHIRRSENLSELLYFAAIFIELYGPEAESKAAEFRLSNYISKGIKHFFESGKVLENHITPGQLRQLIQKTGDYYSDLKLYTGNIINNKNTTGLEIAAKIEPLVINSIKNPFITGSYLKNAGASPGPHFKEVLDTCGCLQAEGKSRQEVEETAIRILKLHES